MNTATVKTEAVSLASYHPKKNSYYFNYITKLYRFLIQQNSRVLHIGCRDGYLLHVLNPAFGHGIDENEQVIEQARNRNPQYSFHAGIKDFVVKEQFDFIILSASSLQTHDVQAFFEEVRRLCGPETRLLIDWHSYAWEPVLSFARLGGFFKSEPMVNKLSSKNVHHFLQLAGFELIAHNRGLLCPWYIPGVSWFLNNIVSLVPGLNRLGLLRWCVARVATQELPAAVMQERTQPRSVSIIIACRNERGTIETAVQRCPRMGSFTEIIFAEGHSKDGTLAEVERIMAAYPEKNIKVVVQPGIGKGDAVRAGCNIAKGDIIMILDADLTVKPEELPKFYEAIVSRRGDFINGSRLVYGMENGAMRIDSFFANHGFSQIFAWLLGQPMTDTLCGTKVFFRKDYERIMSGRSFFGDRDPFGDFDLLFGANRLHRKIINVPIHYKQRVYGTSQISRWRDGFVLLKMTLFAIRTSKMFGR